MYIQMTSVRCDVRKVILKVMPAGLSDNDLQIVKSLCAICANRSRVYVICPPGERPDFYLIDGDKPESIAQSKAARALHPAPAIVLTNRDAAHEAHSVLRRPVVASRILAAFDELAIRLGHTPELRIGDGTEQPVSRLSGILNGSGPTTLHMGAIAPRRGLALVVDDSPTVRKQLELSLQSLGVDVEVAEDGDIALRKIALNRYDIIFLDVVLPGADGYQICKTIKKDKAAKDTPVIMLTGKTSPFDRIKGSLAGCDTYLTKPVNNETFRGVVEKYLGDSPKERIVSAGTLATS
jgi:two-component system cell cycle response regulator